MYRREQVKVFTRVFEKIAVGDNAEISHHITQNDVDAFAALTGDYNPLHVDASFAQQTSFKRPVVHGMLSASFISTMIGTLLPGQGALWTSQSLEFLLPVFVGDTITVKSSVAQKSESVRALVLETHVTNQHGQEVLRGKSSVRLLQIEKPVMKKTNGITNSRTIVITGASRGIGAAIARRLAAAGHRVIITYHSAKEAAETLVSSLCEQKFAVACVQVDVREQHSVERLKKSANEIFGAVDDVVHCAAVLPVPLPFEQTSWNQFQEQIDTQLKGAFTAVQIFLPDMLAKESGSFLFIGSIFGEGVPPLQQSPYVTAKAALAALARSLAVEFGPKGIRVNVVAPGMTQTDMIAAIPDKTKLLTKMQTPLRKLGDPDDVASVVEFLLGHGSAHISGETIRVCGGIAM